MLADHSIAGSIFQIRQADQTDCMSLGGLIYFLTFALTLKLATTVTSSKNIGLATDGISDLNSFVAAAGYTDASAVLDNIGDPEFVWNG